MNLQNFLSGYNQATDDEYLVFGVLPSDSYVVCEEDQSEEDQRLLLVCEELYYELAYTAHGFTVDRSPNSKVYRITWPSDLVSSPSVYVITNSMVSP